LDRTDRNLLFARPHVLSAARVRENWFLVLTKRGAPLPRASPGVNRRFLPVSAPIGRTWPGTAPLKQGVRGPGRAVPLGASSRTVAQAGKRQCAGAPDP